MAQGMKAPDTKPDDLDLFPSPHTAGGRADPYMLSSDFSMCILTEACTYTNNQNKKFNEETRM